MDRETYKFDRESLRCELETLRNTELPAASKVFIEDFYARKYLGKRTSVYTDLLRESSTAIAVDEAYINDVEEGVIDYYLQQGADAFFTENKLWRVLFAFTFWELLFGENQVQHSEFDRLPPLLRNGKFYVSLATEIERRLEDLNSPESLIKQFYQTGNPALR